MIGVQGYSGQVDATATAPSVLVYVERPTKNSLPVKRTSDPQRRAVAAFGSTMTCKGGAKGGVRGAFSGENPVERYLVQLLPQDRPHRVHLRLPGGVDRTTHEGDAVDDHGEILKR